MSNDKRIMEMLQILTMKVDDLNKQLRLQKKLKNYTYIEASITLGLTVEGLKSRIKRGRIKRIANGNKPLIAHSEIERYLKEQNP